MIKPRWFRFSLRTLFVLFTVLAIWLGWNAQRVHERKAILAEIMRLQATGTRYMCLETLEDDPQFTLPAGSPDTALVRVSPFRRLFGDETCLYLGVPGPLDPRLVERMELAFPEARLAIYLPGDDAVRDSLYLPTAERRVNRGTIFKTGLIEK